MLACHLKDATAAYFKKKRRAISFEVGLCKDGRYRADVLVLSMSSEIVIGECKSGIADFRSDKKWKNYLEYCNRFYFIVDNETWNKIKGKVPKGRGVMVVSEINDGPRTKYKVRVVQVAKWYPVADDIRLNIAIRMAFKSADVNRFKRKA